MCNAYTFHTTLEAMRRLFGARGSLNLPEYLDAFPGRDVLAIRDGEFSYAYWGFMPGWAKRLFTFW